MPSPICPAVGAARHPEGRAEQGDMMPLFGKPADGAGSAWEPEAAEGRLAHTFGADPTGVFTSDLSVSEYVLLGEAGFEPLGFVIGSSIYHIGLQIGKWSQNQELQVLTQAMYNARELAMTRMQAEAEHLGADGTVGVELRMQAYVWGQDVLEFIATGDGRQGHRQLFGGAPSSGWPSVHLGSVGSGLLPPPGRRRGPGGFRPRDLRVPHRASIGLPGAASDRSEPGDDDLHPGHLRSQGAGPYADADRSGRGAGFGHRRGHRRGLQPRLG